jgi:hypothetical protein
VSRIVPLFALVAVVVIFVFLVSGGASGDEVEPRAPVSGIPEECQQYAERFERENRSRSERTPSGRCARWAQPIGELRD